MKPSELDFSRAKRPAMKIGHIKPAMLKAVVNEADDDTFILGKTVFEVEELRFILRHVEEPVSANARDEAFKAWRVGVLTDRELQIVVEHLRITVSTINTMTEGKDNGLCYLRILLNSALAMENARNRKP